MVAIGCAAKPPPTPMSLRVPPPPAAEPGSLRIYGDRLPEERAAKIRERVRAAEPALLSKYQDYLAEFPGVEGRLQLRFGINKDGKVVDLVRVYSEVPDGLGVGLRPVLADLAVGPGPEAFVYYTLDFRPDPCEVLDIQTDFAGSPPALVATVENRSAFHLPVVSATVTVLGPEKEKPLRVYRRRLAQAFAPGERRKLRIPVGSEWATTRNTFLVSVRPVVEAAAESPDPKDP